MIILKTSQKYMLFFLFNSIIIPTADANQYFFMSTNNQYNYEY